MGRGLSTLLKLSLLEATGWDLAHVRQTVSLSYYFNELGSRFESVGKVVDDMQKRSPVERASSFPTGCARALRMVQQWYEAKVVAEAAQNSERGLQGMAVPMARTGQGLEDAMLDDAFDYMSEANWLDLMGDCNFSMQAFS